MDQALQNQWAETTLSVAKNIAHAQGARYYPNDPLRREDLFDWLIVHAQEIANTYTPKKDAKQPETYWAGYLTKSLRDRSRWHWASTIGRSDEAHQNAHNNMDSIDRLIHDAEAKTIHLEQRMTPLTHNPFLGPTEHHDRIERLKDLCDRLENTKHINPPNTHCLEADCPSPPIGKTNRCTRHQTEYLSLWRPGPRCKTEFCPDGAVKRGWCPKHYQSEWMRHKAHGIPWEKKAILTQCAELGCGKPHHANGLCAGHNARRRRAGMPPCTYDNCDRPQSSKGLCNAHYKRMKRGTL